MTLLLESPYNVFEKMYFGQKANGGIMSKKKKESYDLSSLSRKRYSISNNLINAKGKTTALAEKLFHIGIHQAELEEGTEQLVVTLHGTELRELFGDKSGSFYDRIKELVTPDKEKASLLDWRIIYANDETKEISAVNVVTDCEFKNGTLRMRYNNKVTKSLYNLKKNYTQFSLAETIPLRSIYSLRLYEILKAEYDRQCGSAAKMGIPWDYSEPCTWVVNLTDLKLRLGIIDPNENREIANALLKSNVDYDFIEKLANEIKGKKSKDKKKAKEAEENIEDTKEAEEDTEKTKYSEWGDFRKNVILVAKKELDQKTSIRFEFEPERSGLGGKTHGIKFFIYKDIPQVEVTEEEKKLTDEEKDEIIDQMSEIISEKLKLRDLRAIAEAAKYDLKKIQKAYDILSAGTAQVENVTGFMIKAIQEGYEAPVKANRKGKNKFNNFERRNDINFDELEDILLDN